MPIDSVECRREMIVMIDHIRWQSHSPGFGSVNMEQMESSTLDIVRAGDHWSRRMSRQMLPLLLMFGW